MLNLVNNLETRTLLCNDPKFLETLVKMGLRHNGDVNIQYMVAATMDVITKKKDFAKKVLDTVDSVECLIQLSGFKMNDDVIAEAARALFNLVSLEDKQSREFLASTGLVEVLRLISKDKPIEVRMPALDALSILTNNEEKIKQLEQQYGLDFSYGVVEEKKKEGSDED